MACSIRKALRQFVRGQDGVATFEYALLFVLVVAVAFIALDSLSTFTSSSVNQSTNLFGYIARKISEATAR